MPVNSRLLTLETLKQKKACNDQLEKFENLFGKQVIITVDLCRVHAKDFDWIWASDYLLTDLARAEHERAIASAQAEYERVTVSAWAELYIKDAKQ